MPDINAKIKEKMEELKKPADSVEQQKPDNTQPPENAPNSAANNQPPKVEFGDSDVLTFLKEKKNAQFESIEDLLRKPESIQFASAEVESLNTFITETGRGLNDFLNINKDRSNLSEVELAREYYLQKNPHHTADDFNVLHDVDLQPLNPEDNDPVAVDQTDRAIRKRDAQLKSLAHEAKGYFDDLSEKLKQPIERANSQAALAEQGATLWKEGIQSAAQQFDLGVEGYEFKTTKEDLTEKYSSPGKILDIFKNADGAVDYAKMMQTIERGLASDDIAKVLSEKAANANTETIVGELENSSNSSSNNTPIDPKNADLERMKNKLRNFYSR